MAFLQFCNTLGRSPAPLRQALPEELSARNTAALRCIAGLFGTALAYKHSLHRPTSSRLRDRGDQMSFRDTAPAFGRRRRVPGMPKTGLSQKPSSV